MNLSIQTMLTSDVSQSRDLEAHFLTAPNLLIVIVMIITTSYGMTLMFIWLSILRYQGLKMVDKRVTCTDPGLSSCIPMFTRNQEYKEDW